MQFFLKTADNDEKLRSKHLKKEKVFFIGLKTNSVITIDPFKMCGTTT
jgi:hypothetical protein